MEALKINKSLWSLPLDFSFDSSEINELITRMEQLGFIRSKKANSIS